MKRLNMIGAGKVGRTLGALWAGSKTFEVGDILTRSRQSARSAVEFIQAGNAINEMSAMTTADIYLICTPDNHIAESCKKLSASGLLRPADIVFHCSGAQPSSILHSVRQQGAFTASIHPVKSFANPAQSINTMVGTLCGSEGDEQALKILKPAFEAIGGKIFPIDPQFKTIYHAAAVIASNYLNSLLEISSQAYLKAGLDQKTTLQIIEPVVRGTIDNIFANGIDQALTGPVARGDHAVVAKQLQEINDWNPLYGKVYRDLAAVALQISRRQGHAPEEELAILQALLDKE